jgi:rhodanese-related sulfurtransferase
VKSLLRQSLLLIGLALLPGIGQALYYRDTIPWRSRIAESDLVEVGVARGWGDTAVWIDARPDAEFERDHVPGAISLNEDRWSESLSQFLNERWSPEKKIVIYCSSQSCNLADDVARRLREEAKLPNEIRVLKGGWEEWLKEKQ